MTNENELYMIAEVYPLRRISRAMSFFDYEIPERTYPVRGSFVEIPIRAQTTLGIVRRVKDIPPRGIRLKPIMRVLPELSLQENELSFFEAIAESIAQPAANLLYSSLPQPPAHFSTKSPRDLRKLNPLTIPSSECATVARLAKQMTQHRSAFVQAPDLRRTAAILAHYFNQHAPEKRVLVCPHVRDARLLAQGLSAFDPLIFTGEESPSERFETWQIFRSSKNALLITTRAGMFCVDASTTCVCLIRSGHSDHVQHDRNPRLDSRIVMTRFAEQFTASLFFFDVCPLPEDVFHFGLENIFSYAMPEFVNFIDASQERPASEHVAMTTSCVQAITQTLQNQQRVLLVYNKKGYGIRLRCQDCHYRFACSKCGQAMGVNRQTIFCNRCGQVEPMPLRCASCRSTRIHVRGFGNERILEALQSWFPEISIAIVDKEHPASTSASIILATRYYLENNFDPFHPEAFALVIHLDPDTPLFTPTFRATERALWSVAEWSGFAHSVGAAMLIQTEESELFRSYLRDFILPLSDELRLRQEFNQPPFSHWISVTLKEQERKKCELEEYLLKQKLERIPGVIVTRLSMQRSDRSLLHIRVTEEHLPDVRQIFSMLDDRYLIDMNAFS
jgi:primosomal protein N'